MAGDAERASGRGQPLYLGIYIGMIVFFAFFYTAIVFNPQDTADNLRNMAATSSAFVPARQRLTILTVC